MQYVENKRYSLGTIIVPCSSLSRFAAFWMSLETLYVPTGTRLIVQMGADIPHQLNEGIRQMVGEWVWILGDDHTFDPLTLLKLLDRQVDIVMPVVPRRDPPYKPVLVHGPLSRKMHLYEWTDLPIEGLFQLPKNDPAGQACMLIRRPVLGRLGDPWFEGGKLVPGRLMEDMYFVQRLHDLNIPIWIDCDLSVGHIANITIVPQKYNGRWWAGYKYNGHPILWQDVTIAEAPAENSTESVKPLFDPRLATAVHKKHELETWEQEVESDTTST